MNNFNGENKKCEIIINFSSGKIYRQTGVLLWEPFEEEFMLTERARVCVDSSECWSSESHSIAIISQTHSLTHSTSVGCSISSARFNHFVNVEWIAYWIFTNLPRPKAPEKIIIIIWREPWQADKTGEVFSLILLGEIAIMSNIPYLCRLSFPQCENLWKSFCDKVLLFADEFIWKRMSEQRGRERVPKRKKCSCQLFVKGKSERLSIDNDEIRLTMNSHRVQTRQMGWEWCLKR